MQFITKLYVVKALQKTEDSHGKGEWCTAIDR